MRPKFKPSKKTVQQVALGAAITYGFVLACTLISALV